MTPVTNAQTTWNSAYPAHVTVSQNAQSARQTKDGAPSGVETAVRPLVRRLQASPSVSDAERAALGITVPDPGGCGTGFQPVNGPPVHRLEACATEVVTIECGPRLQHTVGFTDEATPTRKAKPAGVLGAEIWVNILPVGQPTPTDPASFNFVALDTRTPYTLDFAGADGGKNTNYFLRWVNPTGEKGPWSETTTIGAE